MNETEVRELATILMAEHHLMRDGWTLRIGNASRYFGYCYRSKKLITISGPISALNGEADVRDTILHEIAHALAPEFAHHGPEWKAIAARIGADPTRCYDASVDTPPARYIGTADTCGHTCKKMVMRQQSCGKCSGGKYNKKYRIRWTPNPDYRPI